MPLVTLRTNFKNLKFGKDRPGGGSSNQPYITKDIPSGDPSNIFNTGGIDSLLRGGLMAPLKAANDVSRLTQMFFDLKSPNGLLFTAKQNVLSRSSVETEATKGPAYGGKAVNQGIYTPLSTIAQAAAGFTGTHLNLLGLDPSSPMAGVTSGGIFPSLGLNRYEDAVKGNNEGDGSPGNRLVKLTKSTDLFLSEYSGGPGSVLGIGKTKIPFSSQRTGENNPQSKSNPEYFYSGSRPWGKTKDSWISPVIKGASFKYQEFEGSNLLEFDGNSVITSDGDYTFEPNFYNKTTKVDSLEPKGDLSTYQTSVPWGKTKDSWISPIIKGASSKYQEFGGLNLLEFGGSPVITSDGDYTFEPNFYNKTTKVDSLEPTSDIGTYQTSVPWGKTKDSWISPIIKGASSKYQEFGGLNLLEFDGSPVITSDGDYTFEPNFYNKTTKVDSLEPTSDIGTYQTSVPWGRSKDSWISPIIKGASFKYQEFGGLNLLEFNGDSVITSDGDYTFEPNFYNKTTKVDSLEPTSRLDEYQTLNKTTLTLGGEQQGGVRINYDNTISPKGVSKTYNSLISESSPNSILKTTYTNRNGFSVYTKNSFPEVTPLQSKDGSKTWNQTQINNATLFFNEPYGDFRRELIGSPESPDVQESHIMSLAPDYRGDKNIEQRVNLGDPGKRKNVLRYSTDTEILDKITAKEIYSGNNPDHLGDQNDLVKFSIGIVENSNSSTSNYMNFRAFIDSFQDNYTADWGEVQYLGRADKFYNYKGFNRDISLSWTVPAQSKAELIPMYKKLNYLASSLAPSYSSKGFMQGNLARLTVGGYLYNQLGIIRSITYDVPTESPWEIGINEAGGFDSTVKELPMMIKVTGFKFTPIHEFVPEKSLINPTQNKRYIALSTNSNNNYDN